MPADHNPPHTSNIRITAALALLAAISEKEEQWAVTEDLQAVQTLQAESLSLYDQVIASLRAAGENWFCAWVMLKKASLAVELARSAPPAARQEVVDKVIQLAQQAFAEVENDTNPGLDRIAKLCLASIDPLLRMRTLLEQPDQVDAVDEFIRALSTHYGETLALTFQMRSEAYDRYFNAQVIASMIPTERDPGQQLEMKRKCRALAIEAYEQLLVSGDPNSSSVFAFIRTLEALTPPAAEASGPTCPACGFPAPANALFCSQCGARLSQEAR